MKRIAGATVKGGLRVIIVVLALGTALDAQSVLYPSEGTIPADPRLLWAQVEDFVHLAPAHKNYDEVSAIIVPDGNYIITGSLLGKAYSTVIDRDYDVVVFVVSDRFHPGIFVSTAEKFGTPLGYFNTDTQTVNRIVALCPEVVQVKNLAPKGVWYQLPFVKYAIGSPLVMVLKVGKLGYPTLVSVSRRIAKSFGGKKVLIVGVGRFSEGDDDSAVAASDKVAIGYLERLDAEGLYKASEAGIVHIPDVYGVIFSILLAGNLGARRGDVLKHITTTGIPRERFSGMVAAVLYNREIPSQKRITITPTEGMKLWELAYQIIFNRSLPESLPRSLYRHHCGVFITLADGDSIVAQTGDLFTNMNLVEAVAKYSKLLVSPRRIPRVVVSQLKQPVLSVSVAEPVEDVKLPEPDMGIYIRHGDKVIVAMPGEFANFPPEKRLEKTCLKGGIPSRGWCSPDCEIYFFRVQSFSDIIKKDAQGAGRK